MGKINITSEQCSVFPGGWSIKPDQMFTALSNVEYTDKLKILELGAGVGTNVLADLLTKLGVPFTYVSYENDPVYACTRPDVQTVMWTTWPTELVKDLYDLVIIDGPAGRQRVHWYPLIRDVVHPGTIILVDDYCHFAAFKLALNLNFKHHMICEKTQSRQPTGGQISWVVTRVISAVHRRREKRRSGRVLPHG